MKTFVSKGMAALAITLTVLVCFSQPVHAENEYRSEDVPKDIPDEGATTSTLVITDTSPIVDLNVKLNISHRQTSELSVYLFAPDGTRVKLFDFLGGEGADFDDTILDDECSVSIKDGSAPYTGCYRPEGSLSDFDGKDISGTWKLRITDDLADDKEGTLNSWSLIAPLPQPLDPPVIQAEPGVPGDCDRITWNDVGQIHQYDSGAAKNIPDSGTATSTLVIDDFGLIEDLNVKVNITHRRDEDLDVYLIAPDSTRVRLFIDVGGSGDHFDETILDDEAPQSITQGSAPFTGSYRPEGSLAEFIGMDISGTWTLEVTDDSSGTSGELNSWSLIADLVDVLYCAQCATEASFDNVVADSGWIIDTSYTFPGLDQNQEYSYRVKARRLETWGQTSQSDFETDTLRDTRATSDGDVVLAGGGGSAEQVHVIENPSFEVEGGWNVGSNTFVLFLTTWFCPGDIWVSDGSWVACVLFSEDYTYSADDGCYFRQSVDWTGVETLMFDCCGIFAIDLTMTVLIGDTEVWSETGTWRPMDLYMDQTVDVSAFSGHHDLRLMVEVNRSGSFIAGVFWDHLRTYGPSGSAPSGSIVSTPIGLNDGDTWDIVAFNATTPAGTALTVDILPVSGSTPIAGYTDILSGTYLGDLSEMTIRLRANLSMSDSDATPALHDWSVTYSNASSESDWSNVAKCSP